MPALSQMWDIDNAEGSVCMCVFLPLCLCVLLFEGCSLS